MVFLYRAQTCEGNAWVDFMDVACEDLVDVARAELVAVARVDGVRVDID